jgi:predicted ribosome quality control (RQC) complex YloA/Tae2 family protein
LFIGKNQYENDQLIKNSAQNDLWFHLDNLSGPHFVLQTYGYDIPKRILNYIGTLFREHKKGLGR